MQSDGALTPAGHRAYCAKNIEDAIKGAGGVSQQSATMRRGVKKNERMTFAQRQMAARRNKRADFKVIAAYRALAKAWLNKANVRDSVDAQINAAKRQRPRTTEYTTE